MNFNHRYLPHKSNKRCHQEHGPPWRCLTGFVHSCWSLRAWPRNTWASPPIRAWHSPCAGAGSHMGQLLLSPVPAGWSQCIQISLITGSKQVLAGSYSPTFQRLQVFSEEFYIRANPWTFCWLSSVQGGWKRCNPTLCRFSSWCARLPW